MLHRTLLLIALLFSSVCLLPRAQAQATGDTTWVWAKYGLNLREQASASAPIVTKLRYGSQVTILPQPEAIKYDLNLYPAVNKDNPGATLKGSWIKVKAGAQEGFVFDQLLLNVPPYPGEDKKAIGYDISSFLAKAFNLSKNKTNKTRGEGITGQQDIISTDYANPSSGVSLKTSQGMDDYKRGSATLIHPKLSLEQALVLFTAILPPGQSATVDYKKGQYFNYDLDPIPNTLSIKPGPKGGVVVEWVWGAD